MIKYLTLLLFCNSVFSQAHSFGLVDGSINSSRYRFSFSPNTATVEDADLSNTSFLVSENTEIRNNWVLLFNYDFSRNSINADAPLANVDEEPLVKENQSLRIGAQKTFSRKWAINLSIPFHRVLLNDPAPGKDKRETSIGDIDLAAKYSLKKSGDLSIALRPFISLPTGSEVYITTDRSVGFGVDGLISRRFKKSKVYGSLGVAFNPKAIMDFNYYTGHVSTVDHKLQLRFGAGYAYDFLNALGLNLEVYGKFNSKFERYASPIQTQLSFKYDLLPKRLGLFGGFGFEGFKPSKNEKTIFVGGKLLFGRTNKYLSDERKETVKESLELRLQVNFDRDKDLIRPDSHQKLDEFYNKLVLYIDDIEFLNIEGHTDSRNSDSYNQDLSERRAKVVKEYLIKKGIDRSKLKSIGFGESKLLNRGNQESDHAENRRVEIKVDFE